ncbi:MAG: hypothetical protein ACYDC9_09290 [Dermatophilaceae bacterium]
MPILLDLTTLRASPAYRRLFTRPWRHSPRGSEASCGMTPANPRRRAHPRRYSPTAPSASSRTMSMCPV